MKNVFATLDKKSEGGGGGVALTPHAKGFMGKINWPLLVAFGHGHPDGLGVGPDLGTGCPGCTMWLCCCFGLPCSAPAGKASAKTKSDFNYSVKPKKGEGISR
jgi:hypothetical protein